VKQGRKLCRKSIPSAASKIGRWFRKANGWSPACSGRTGSKGANIAPFGDHFDSVNIHLGQRDTALAVVSRAPWTEIEPFKKRMGWKFR